MRLYRYVGPAEVLKRAQASNVPHAVIADREHLTQWIKQAAKSSDHGLTSVTATYVIDSSGSLRLADRRSEHVACASGSPVLAAGEITFDTQTAEVLDVSNQSTGYCPESCCWNALEPVMNNLQILHPGAFTLAIEFRLCPACCERNVVKDGWFQCDLCGADLPRTWNFD